MFAFFGESLVLCVHCEGFHSADYKAVGVAHRILKLYDTLALVLADKEFAWAALAAFKPAIKSGFVSLFEFVH